MKMNVIVTLMIALTLSACGGKSEKQRLKDLEAERPAEQIYSRAEAAMSEGEYGTAVKLFDEVERQHPYSQFAIQAQLNSAMASYKALNYDEAIIAFDRFIELHPGHEDVPFAIYMKGQSYYEQISDVKRDQELTKLALNTFDTLIQRFPESNWSREAEYKRDLALDHLAGKEMEVGRYYLTRGHINAAINRFLLVVRQFDTTTHTPEALYRLVESYLTLGLDAQALQVAAVLGHNYPGDKWYERAYELLDPRQRQQMLEDRGFFEKTIDSLLQPE